MVYPVSPFYMGLYEAVDDPSLDLIISWSKSNKSFIIWNLNEFQKQILSTSTTLLSRTCSWFFYRLKYHGFKRIKGSGHLEFGHKEHFVRGQPDLLTKMEQMAYDNRLQEKWQ